MKNCFKGSTKRPKDELALDTPLLASTDLSIVNETENQSFRNDVKLIFKDIDDENIKDLDIIAKIDSLFQKNGLRVEKYLLDAQTGINNYSLLHYAAKNCRANLCKFLIDEISMSNILNNFFSSII